MSLAPILLFAYNRPDHLSETLEALANNHLASESILWIFCDGAKNNASDADKDQIDEVRKLASEQDWALETHVQVSEQNKGLAQSIIDGTKQILNDHDSIIVLEDDLVTGKGFLKYMNDALNFYRDHKEVKMISGFQFPIEVQEASILHRRTTSWGWAIWKDRWQNFNLNKDELIERVTEKGIEAFDIHPTTERYKMLINEPEEGIRSWAIRWAANVYLNNGLVVWPQKSLIYNIGHDGSGENCHENNVFDYPIEENFTVDSFQKEISENKVYLKSIIEYYKSFEDKTPMWQKQAKYYWKRIFKTDKS